MSLKKVEEVKSDRGFKPLDLIIYGIIIALVVAVFLAVFMTKKDGGFTGVQVFVRDECVYEYVFGEGGKVLKDSAVEETGEDGLKKITVTGEDGYNVILIDDSARTVRVSEADCKGRDCVYSPEIKDADGVIYCSPHGLKITPTGRDDGRIIVG